MFRLLYALLRELGLVATLYVLWMVGCLIQAVLALLPLEGRYGWDNVPLGELPLWLFMMIVSTVPYLWYRRRKEERKVDEEYRRIQETYGKGASRQRAVPIEAEGRNWMIDDPIRATKIGMKMWNEQVQQVKRAGRIHLLTFHVALFGAARADFLTLDQAEQYVRSYKDYSSDEIYLAMLLEMVESQVRAHSGTKMGKCFVAGLRLLLDRWDQYGLPESRIPPRDDDYWMALHLTSLISKWREGR